MEHNEMLVKIGEWAVDGVGRAETIKLIKKHSTDRLTDKECHNLIDRAMDLLGESTDLDPKQVMISHINHYEKVYEYFDSIGDTEGKNKALRGKERLVGLLQGNRVTVNKKIDVTLKRTEPKYDMNRLTPEERERMVFLMSKAEASTAGASV